MIPVLIIGKSGAGKSASLRNLPADKTAVINVNGKALPFRNSLATMNPAQGSRDYQKVTAAIMRASKPVYVIDDAGYLITDEFMRSHSAQVKGDARFMQYNVMADHFYNLITAIQDSPEPSRVYIMMHEDKNDFGDIKPKTIGKLLDNQVCIEGLFTICLRAMVVNGAHIFRTQSDGFDVAKSPMGMFDSEEIDNDLNAVDAAICEYYGIKEDGGNEKT